MNAFNNNGMIIYYKNPDHIYKLNSMETEVPFPGSD